MARCTAPVRGHRTASATANCPACSSRYNRRYGSYSPYSSPYASSSSNSSISRGSSSGQTRTKARWSSAGSTILYTPAEIRTLTPVRENVEKRSDSPDYEMFFFVTLGTTVKMLLKNYTIY